MAKYKTEFKMKVVKEYLDGNISYRELAKKRGRTSNMQKTDKSKKLHPLGWKVIK